MFTLIFSLIALIFIFCWWSVTNKKRKNQITKSKSIDSRTSITATSAKPSESKSDFQQWILNYSQTSRAEELDESLRIPYEKDDWTLLDPMVYAKWSKFKWGI
tara:strand:- start:164 stop:472 length:309 start_codon:yes stop_codon:yes gene_type:complete